MDESNKIRLWEIDSLRGLAVMGMIVFHLFYILNFFDVVKNEMYEGGWLWLARFVQLMFLGLVGVSLALSKRDYRKQFSRGMKVLAMGLLISFVTYFFEPQLFVKFGILHLIGIGIISFTAIAHKKYLSLLGGVLVLLIWRFIDFGTSSSLVLHILGLGNTSLYALDYFPIFPWISVILFGIFIGNFLRAFIEKKQQTNFSVPRVVTPLAWLGQNSLLIYMLHIPLIIAVLLIFKIIPFDKLLGT